MAQSKSTPVGTIVGGAVGGVAVLVILVVGIFYLILMIRRTRDSQDNRFERPSRLTEAFPGECVYRFLNYPSENIPEFV